MTKVSIDLEIENIQAAILKVAKENIFDSMKKNTNRFVRNALGSINSTIRRENFFFIPNDTQAGELGIQQNPEAGDIDESRRSGAWQLLLTNHPDSAAIVTLRKRSQSIGELFSLRVGWDRQKFFNHDLTTIRTFDLETGDSFTIPWMKWFLEGAVIQGHTFAPIQDDNKNLSRTGKGIMVKGGLWQFRPTTAGFVGSGPRPTVGLENEIAEDLRIDIQKDIESRVYF